MASYHCTIKSGLKGKAALHALYITREGQYSSKKGADLEFKEHGNMPSWAQNKPHEFWKSADEFERANGRTYKEIEIALPNELTMEQRWELVQVFINENIGINYPYTMAIHCPKAALQRNIPQPHAHIMFSERKLDGIERDNKQFFKRANAKKPELGGAQKDRDWSGKKDIVRKKFEQIRESWAIHQNRALERYGYEIRVDYRSLEAQRIEALTNKNFEMVKQLSYPPEQHLGPKVSQRFASQLKEHRIMERTDDESQHMLAKSDIKNKMTEREKLVYIVREIKWLDLEIREMEKRMAEKEQMSPSSGTKRVNGQRVSISEVVRTLENRLQEIDKILIHEGKLTIREQLTQERIEFMKLRRQSNQVKDKSQIIIIEGNLTTNNLIKQKDQIHEQILQLTEIEKIKEKEFGLERE